MNAVTYARAANRPAIQAWRGLPALLLLLVAACGPVSGEEAALVQEPSAQEAQAGQEAQAELAAQADQAAQAAPGAQLKAMGENLNTTPTWWGWYYGQTASQVDSLLKANNARLVSLQVESASPLRFTVAMVQNTGSHYKRSWFVPDMTGAQLGALAGSLNARIVNVQPYYVNGQQHFAAVLISNTGADGKAWWWWYDIPMSQIQPLLDQYGARLVDLHQYADPRGIPKYAIVMVSNSGSDYIDSSWGCNLTLSQVQAQLSRNSAYLIALEPTYYSPDAFNVIMNRNPGIAWWYRSGIDGATLGNELHVNGARPLDVKTYTVNGARRFTAIMLDNTNSETGRIRSILRDASDGTSGLYLKRVGGSVEESLADNFRYDPASALKTLIAVGVMRQVEAGRYSLDGTFLSYTMMPQDSSCPDPKLVSPTLTLRAVLRLMLVDSDNGATKRLVDLLGGFGAVNAVGALAGMSSTTMNGDIGCANANRMTLADAGRLYEGIATGTIISANSRTALYSVMPADPDDRFTVLGAARAIVDAEYWKFGLSYWQKERFKEVIRIHDKVGNGSDGSRQYRALSGVAELPECSGGWWSMTNYVFGIFIHGATNNDNAWKAFDAAKAEPLRQPIRDRLAKWAPCAR